MGEERFQGTHIHAYLKVGSSQYRVKELGIEGVILEGKALALVEGKPKKVTLVVPFDGKNQIEVRGLKLVCGYGKEETVCYFRRLSKSQKEIIQVILRECNWKRLVPSEKEFMNYTKEPRTRELLLSIVEREQKKRLKLFSYLVSGMVGLIIVAVFFKLFVLPIRPTGKPIEAEKLAKIGIEQEKKIPENKIVNQEAEKIPDTIKELPSDFVVSKVEWNNINTMGKVPPYFNPVNPSESLPPRESVISSTQNQEIKPATPQPIQLSKVKKETTTTQKEKEEEKINLSENEDYLCIQVASDRKPSWLIKISETLKEFPFVRVEKIGRAYTLRVGFFKEKNEAKEILKKIKKRYPHAFIRTCAYRPKRWVHSKK